MLVAVQRPSSQPGEEEQWQVTWCSTPPSSSKPSRLPGGKISKAAPAEGGLAGVAPAAGDGPGGSGVRPPGQPQSYQQLLHRRKLSGAGFISSGSKVGTGGRPGSTTTTSSSSAPRSSSSAAAAAAHAMQQLLAELGGAGAVDTPPGGFKTPAGPKLRLR